MESVLAGGRCTSKIPDLVKRVEWECTEGVEPDRTWLKKKQERMNVNWTARVLAR